MAQERSFPEEKGHLFCPCAVDHSLRHSVSSQFSHSIIEASPFSHSVDSVQSKLRILPCFRHRNQR